MSEHYDVGIYGLWYGHNYGSMITYYALAKVLESMGLSYAMIKNPLGKKIDVDTLRRSHSLRFAAEKYNITPPYKLSEMYKLNEMFDKFVIGSDQMWNYSLSRPYKQSYFLDFAADDKIKISYASSFGREKCNIPVEERSATRKNLQRFDSVSVRDDFSKKICEQEFGTYAELVLDPVFLCPDEKYTELIEEAELSINEPYIFAYILDPVPEMGAAIQKLSEVSGKKAVIAFNEGSDKDKCINALGITAANVEYLREPTVNEWLYCFKNADFVVADSFHGACFSIIFNKDFIVLQNVLRGGARFPFLLGGFGLMERMAHSHAEIVELYTRYCAEEKIKIDYSSVNKILNEKKAGSFQWLKDAIEKPLENRRKVTVPSKAVQSNLDPKMCMGCSACVNICPKNALELQPDEHGYYRSVIDYDKCVDCGLCTKICPAIDLPENTNASSPELYEFIAADEQVLWNSSSGGAFPLLSAEAFKRGGVVVGAAWRDDFTVEHIMIDKPEDLHKLQKSKYLQTYMGDIYTQTKRKLEDGVFVLFSSCPCQIAGLKAFLGKDYDNLVMIDLLCGNSPSALFFKKYIEEDFPIGLEKYEFRHKVQGWTWDCTTTTTTTNGVTSVRRGQKQDNYQRVYHNHTMCPPHCEKCRYQAVPRFGDITIGDFWGIGRKDTENDVKKGTSAVLCNNRKGKEFFAQIPEEAVRVRKQVPLEWLGGNGYAINGSHNYCSPKRDLFYEAIKTMPFSKAVTYALKPNHGVYEKPGSLNYDIKKFHFHFDPLIWEESYIKGVTVLYAKTVKPPTGNYCILPIPEPLKVGKTYRLKLKYKIQTDSPEFNFHIKDSGSRIYQIIHSHKVTADNRSKWVEIDKEFVPDCDFYDEFMIGAAQLKGADAYIAFEYIYII